MNVIRRERFVFPTLRLLFSVDRTNERSRTFYFYPRLDKDRRSPPNQSFSKLIQLKRFPLRCREREREREKVREIRTALSNISRDILYLQSRLQRNFPQLFLLSSCLRHDCCRDFSRPLNPTTPVYIQRRAGTDVIKLV